MVKDHKGYLFRRTPRVDLGVVSLGPARTHTPSLIGCRLLPYRWGSILCPIYYLMGLFCK